MKRFFLLLLTALCMISPTFAQTEREVLYFYENYCESCTPEEDFAEYFRSLTGTDLADCAYSAYNVVRSDGRSALETAVEKYQLTDDAVPLVIVDGVAYSGASQMETGLAQASLSWGTSTDSAIVYLYVPACESCARVVSVLDALPETVTLKRGALEIQSPVSVQCIDLSAQPTVGQALFEAYNVPDDQRITPIVFFADRYLSGADAIEKNLASMVNLGWAAGGVNLPDEALPRSASALSLTGTVGAGLIAGLNTCALSMLLLFLSLILEMRKHTGWLAFSFLAAKFVCYLLIGFVLLEIMQRFNPLWLQPLARIVLTVMGAALIALNLWDAWQARRENFGKIRNQLPAFLRGRLHRIIRAMTKTRVLVPAVIALGFLVALGEFLCAGQLYLMQLLSAMGSGSGMQALNLLLYCLAFIAPSAVVCLLVLHGRSQMRVSAFLAEHMVAAKLITAAAMLALILTAWLI